MRKVLAILFTIISLFALKETFYIFNTAEAEIVAHHKQFKIVALSVLIPLTLFTLWLWSGKKKTENI